MGELEDSVRKTYVLSRGMYDAPTVEVKPTALNSVLKFDTTKYPRNRLGLAKWTIDKKNPLTCTGLCKPGLAGIIWKGSGKNNR